MGRGLGKTNMSTEELKEAKRERDANRYALNKKTITKTNYHLAKNAISITCAYTKTLIMGGGATPPNT